ncbi:MAG: ABC transporter permease [Bacteroidota bacterium]
MTLFQEFAESLVIAFRSIMAQKLRALLTTLGIIIGIVSVTAMVTTINGIERGFDRSLAMLGENMIYVERNPWFIAPSEWWKYRSRPPLERDMADFIRDRARYASAVAPVAQSGGTVRHEDVALTGVFMQGSTPDLARMGNTNLEAGRFYNELDTRSARSVCVIGQEVREKMFPTVAAVGKTIRINGKRCEVIGVLERQGKFLGLFSFDEQVQMPITTFEKFFGRRRGVTIQVQAQTAEAMDAAQDELTGIVRLARRLDPLEEDNFSINRNEGFRTAVSGAKGTIYTIGLFLTALSLLVGGIGVMNIMFVSVKERTREIGIRKAMGAKRRTILLQFLVEAVLLSLVGGVIGVGISSLVTILINNFFTAQLTGGTVVMAFAICALVGVIFGLVPAWTAAKAKPIDALRYS